MNINQIQKQTDKNIQEKANLIWQIATHLVGLYKPHEYGKVILPFTVLKRFDDALKPTKQDVLDAYSGFPATMPDDVKVGVLTKKSKYIL